MSASAAPPAPLDSDTPNVNIVRLRPLSSIALIVTTLVGIGAFVWTLLARPDQVGSASAHQTDAPWLLIVLLPLLVVTILGEMTAGRLDAKAVALLGVLAAVGTALRLPTGGVAGLELVFFVFLPGGRVFGRGFGFVLGATTIFASALVVGGIGPWLPFQMFAAGWVGFGAGCLPRATGRRELALLGAYGVAAGLLYGVALDLWFWPFSSAGTTMSFVAGDGLVDNLRRFWAFHLSTALGFDLMRGLSMVMLMSILGRPTLAALRRASRRAHFDTIHAGIVPAEDIQATAISRGRNGPAPGDS